MCQLTLLYPTKKLTKAEHAVGRLLLTNLMVYNSKAGNQDGIGIVSGTGRLVKWEDSATAILPTVEWKEKLLWAWEDPTTPMIAHVRAISTGAAAQDGAHPFNHRNVIGAHNGTFNNYRELMKDVPSITDPNPVDSMVVVHMLGEAAGDGPITYDIIKEVLDKTTGSYAMLLLSLPDNAIWVVRGSCQLYYIKYGPFHVINTLATSLNQAIAHTTISARMCSLPEYIPEGEPAFIETYTANTMTTNGLVVHGKLEVPKTTVWKGTTQQHTYHRGYASSGKKVQSDKSALERARCMRRIMLNPGLFETDINLMSQLLFDAYWYDLPINIFLALEEGLESAVGHNTTYKNTLWWAIQEKVQYQGHEAICTLVDGFEIPYYLNTEKALQDILSSLGGVND